MDLVKIKEARWDDDGSSIFPFRKFRSRLVRDQQYPIPFNRPWFTGNEVAYISDAVNRGHISGNGYYTKKCQQFFEEKYGFRKCLLTTSCTDALEMSAILLDIQPGDEVIMPAFTFVSTANAFVLRGAKIVFVDSRTDHPGMDEHKLEGLITPSTKAIVVVHYGGIACDMDVIMALAEKHRLFVVEDAAQAVDSYYKGKPLGGIGHLGCFSFHETKNLSSGEGGMLVVNDDRFRKRAEIIWEKGTNRAAFFRGEVDKYGWVDVGSSFLPSDLIAAVLWAQLEVMDKIAGRRNEIWQQYFEALKPLEAKGWFRLPVIPGYATNNAHVFYLVMNDAGSRAALIQYLKKAGIMAVFHYQSLNKSGYYDPDNSAEKLPNSSIYSDCLVRLPLYYQLLPEQQKVINSIRSFFEKG